eukprot:gb/GECG01014634.1/.p1 GENE.gb/GECG01014634.1/~~gb/GECG01014634.1/.p1  ORF type:complete len:676 (+),score=83.78 gb/GECG01014634.1/:1-2028(+)
MLEISRRIKTGRRVNEAAMGPEHLDEPTPKRRRVAGSRNFADVLSSWLSCGCRRYGGGIGLPHVEIVDAPEVLSAVAEALTALSEKPVEVIWTHNESSMDLPCHDWAFPLQKNPICARTVKITSKKIPYFLPFQEDNVLLMRQCVNDLLEGLVKWVTDWNDGKKKIPGMLFLTGTSGMGKSVLVWLFIQQMISLSYTVVYCTMDSGNVGSAFIIWRKEDESVSVQRIRNAADVALLRSEHVGTKVVQVKGGRGSTEMEDISDIGCTLSVSSVRDSAFRNKTKKEDSAIVYLPKFSQQEAILLGKLRVFFGLPHPTGGVVLQRFDKVGGCPRFLFQELNSQYRKILNEQEKAVNSLLGANVGERLLQTQSGEQAARFVVHLGVLPGESVEVNKILQNYAWDVDIIASPHVKELIANLRRQRLSELSEALTSIGSRGQPYHFEKLAIEFTEGGFSFTGRNGKISIPATRAARVLKSAVDQGIYRLTWTDLCIPLEDNFPVVDAWSIHFLVQVTLAKRHGLNWKNKTFKRLLRQLKDERNRREIEGNIPLIFLVPQGQSCETWEVGARDPGVDVYIVSLSECPSYAHEYYREEPDFESSSVASPEGGAGGSSTEAQHFEIPTGEAGISEEHPTREVVEVEWKDPDVRRSERLREQLQAVEPGTVFTSDDISRRNPSQE